MKGYREKLFQNEWLSTGMSCAESCAVSAIKKFQTLAGKAPEQPVRTLKMALHGSGGWTRQSRWAGGWIMQRFLSPKLFHDYVIFHISGFFLSFIVPLEIELCMYSKEKLLQKENKTVIKWQLNGSFHFF